MSDDTPTGPDGPTSLPEPTGHPAPLGSYETVGPAPADSGGPRRRSVIAGVAVAVVALLGGAAYGAYSFLDGGGPQPAEVLPASTLAMVSIDLDPSASQKIAAIKAIRKFPALKQSLGLQADDDLRRFAFDKIVRTGDCKGLDFDRDVKPWLGERAAVAVVDLGEPNPSPAIALQISDPEKAQKEFQALVDCSDPSGFGFAVGDNYLVGSDSVDHAKALLAEGDAKPLSGDAAYRKWTDAAGDPGVLNFYVAPRAGDYLARVVDGLGSGLRGFATPGGVDPASPDPLGPAKDSLKDFQGAGGTVRFSDGGMELAVAGGGITQLKGLTAVGQQVGDLPADTAAALGFGVSKSFADQIVKGMADSNGSLADAERETGLTLPGDLQTLLGQAVTLSLGGHAPESLDAVKGPADVPAGLVIHGDAAKIRTLIATVEDHIGMHLSDIPVVVDGTQDKVVLATSRDYADELLKAGELGSDAGFRAAAPNAAKSNGILFLDFDSPWRDTLVGLAGEQHGSSTPQQVDENTKPLRAFGMSSWQDGDVSHVLLKVTTD